jgi:hypothetical protein
VGLFAVWGRVIGAGAVHDSTTQASVACSAITAIPPHAKRATLACLVSNIRSLDTGYRLNRGGQGGVKVDQGWLASDLGER